MDLKWAVGLNATALHCWKTPQGQPRKAGGGRPHYWHGTQTTTSFEQPLWWYMSVSNTLPVELIGVLPFQKPCAGGRHLPTAIWRRAEEKLQYEKPSEQRGSSFWLRTSSHLAWEIFGLCMYWREGWNKVPAPSIWCPRLLAFERIF